MHDLTADVCVCPQNGRKPAADAYDEDRVRALSNEEVVGMLAEKIRNNARRYYPEIEARSVTVLGRAWGGKGSARTFRFDILPDSGPGSNRVFVKLYPVYERFNPALLEFETLQLLYERMPSVRETCHVSRPLDFYPDLNAYVMESAGVRTFKDYLLRTNTLLRPGDSLTELFSITADCAVWLKTFHEVTRSSKTRKFDFKTYLDSINQDCDYRALRTYRFKRETIAAMDLAMERLVSCNGVPEQPCAKAHWDFTPAHVYLDNGRIRVIDILGGDDLPVYEDLGRFLAAMSTVNNLPWHPLFDHRRAAGELCDRFLDAYAQGREHDPEQFMLFTRIYTLKHLIIWFGGQQLQVSGKIHPAAGRLFANYRLVGLFEQALCRTAGDIARRIGGLA